MRIQQKKRMKFRWGRTLGISFLLLVLTFPFWIGIFYPMPHPMLVDFYSRETEIDPYLIYALIRQESRYQPAAESSAGAQGLMQLLPETANWLAEKRGMEKEPLTETQLKDPAINIHFGCLYLAWLKEEFNGQLPLMLAAYNAGHGQVQQWMAEGVWDGTRETLDAIPFEETKSYVRGVLTNYDAYQKIDRLRRLIGWQEAEE